MNKANTLSKQSDYNQVKKDNNGQMLLKIQALEIFKIESRDR